jgi:hypothetical protein
MEPFSTGLENSLHRSSLRIDEFTQAASGLSDTKTGKETLVSDGMLGKGHQALD